MSKKIAILAILIGIFIAGNLLASQTNDLHVWIWAQDQLELTLKVHTFPQPTYVPSIGDWNNIENDWICLDWEIFVSGERVLYGTFPSGDDYDIEIPIIIPHNEDPEE